MIRHRLLRYAEARRIVDSEGLQPLARKIFEGLHGSYDTVLSAATLGQDRYWKTWLLRQARLREGMRVLDLGFGTGVLEELLDDSRVSVEGLDLTEEMLRLGQAKRIGCVKSLIVGDGERLPFRDASFDVVLSCYVVKYCSSRRLASEVIRVLRPGGWLLTYDFSSPKGPLAPFHAFYVYGLLRAVGLLLKPVDPRSALTYSALPSVIQSRRWDETFGPVLNGCGFSSIGKKRLSGGVVTAFWGRK